MHARAAGYSPYHLARRFRVHTGSSIHRYRTRLPLLVALSRLREGAADLAGLAADLGFASHSHFTTAFGAMFGTTPTGRARPRGERFDPNAPGLG